MAKKQKIKQSPDSVYFLKVILLLILGSLWVKATDGQSWQLPVPIGFLVGLLLVSHEHFQIDRKIEYAVLIISMFIGFWLPIGLYINM